ncbi:MAG TPA: hypothetical protein EYP04_11170, partial [Anaerolineae bacterium]|nr:hypothetical protein [Anaerolineae bacterium]
MKRLTILLALISIFLLTTVALANGPAYGLSWYVIGGGGGPVAAGAYALDATVGQPAVGVSSGYELNICSGYWCGTEAGGAVFLPMVLKRAQADQICDLLQTSEVDLAILNTAPLRVQFDIISTGQVLQSN